jgi:hypothetical protein
MNLKSKISHDAIERAHRTLEALPKYEPDELTKSQAIQKLLGDMRAAQAKGYSLAAIGKMLADCGIPITTGALRAYVSDASGAGGKKKRRPVKPSADGRKGPAPAMSKGSAKIATTQPAPMRGRRAPAGRLQHVDFDWEPAARSSNGSAAEGGLDAHPDLEDL